MHAPTIARCRGLAKNRHEHTRNAIRRGCGIDIDAESRPEPPPLIADQPGTCRVCGCTDYQACPGSCWWVEPDLCSACAPGGA